MSRQRYQRGFTVWEVILAVTILGVMSWMMAPTMRSYMAAKENANRDAQYVVNQKIANAMLQWSAVGGTDPSTGLPTMGQLPFPCSTTTLTPKLQSGIPLHATCTHGNSLVQYILQQGVPYPQIATDGSTGGNVRVFQKVNSGLLYQNVGLMYPAGPKVMLNYEAGVVYSTTCGQKATCISTATGVVPSANILGEIPDPGGDGTQTMPDTAWIPKTSTSAPINTDFAVAYVSTLPLQKALLAQTASQLDAIRSALKNFYAVKQAALPLSTANFYPGESSAACTAGAQTSCAPFGYPLELKQTSVGQGCWDGWYSLDDAASDILLQLGISDVSFGRTAWGGSVQYCRDFDPTLTKGYGVGPHYAALRVTNNPTSGLGPDTTNQTTFSGNNIYISF